MASSSRLPGEALRDAGITPAPPGRILEDWLYSHSTTFAEAAERMQMPYEELEEILFGKKRVDGSMAIKLKNLTGASIQFWLNLQRAADPPSSQ